MALLPPLLPVLLWFLVRGFAPDRVRPGGFLGASVCAGAVGIAVALWSLATQVTERDETKLSAAVLYDAIAAAGLGLGGAGLGFVLVIIGEIALRSRPVSGPSAFGPWLAGLGATALLVRAASGTWSLLGRVGEVAIVLDQRKAGVPARAVDARAIVAELFSTGAITGVSFVLGIVAVALAVAPKKEIAAPKATPQLKG